MSYYQCTQEFVCFCVPTQMACMPVTKHACVHTQEIKIYLCLRAANCRHAAMCPTHEAGCWESDKAKLPPVLHAHAHMCTDSVNRPVRDVEPWQSLSHHQDYCIVIYALSAWWHGSPVIFHVSVSISFTISKQLFFFFLLQTQRGGQTGAEKRGGMTFPYL